MEYSFREKDKRMRRAALANSKRASTDPNLPCRRSQPASREGTDGWQDCQGMNSTLFTHRPLTANQAAIQPA
jgi:hypothetical protein